MTFKKRILLFLGLAATTIGCQPEQCQQGLEQLPMYGNVRKCAAQNKTDRRFLDSCDQQFHDRKLAAKAFVTAAWDHFNRQDYTTSMLHFNQAWLLDSTNADVYWGMGNILGFDKQFGASVPLFQRSLTLNPTNPRVYDCLAISLGQLFVSTGQDSFLYQTIGASMISAELAPGNATAYANLASAYTYFSQHDSARKYVMLADQIDPDAVNPQVRIALSKEDQQLKAGVKK